MGLRCRKLRIFLGKFLNFGKSAGVKDLTNIMSGGICDKYEICPCHVNDNDKYKTLMKLKEKTLKMHYFHVVHRHAAHITGLAGAASEIPILLHTI